MPQLFPEEKFADYKMPKLEDFNHYTAWAHACLGDGDNEVELRLRGAADGNGSAGRDRDSVSRRSNCCGTAKRPEFTHHADATARLTKEYRAGWALPKA